ncbi:MAG: hypothetical protein JXB07_17270 [Anaerolineae bacterium]|nr:hypothetical protein [Anaerolineae bacterium]
MENVLDWLLAGPAWIEYRTRLDLLDEPENSPSALAARQAMIATEQVQNLLDELADWPGPVLSTHKNAGLLLHKLTFLADLGIQPYDGLSDVVDRILEHQSPEGPFQIPVNIPKAFGGSGEDRYAWMLCDAPLVLYALGTFGLDDDPRVRSAAMYLIDLIRENGWPCAATADLGKFKGPGRKIDPCPYANLVMLKALARMPEWRDSSAAHTGAETLLALWNRRTETRPYLFGMGRDFGKLKAPLVWYDILHVLDVLTQFPWLKADSRLQEMADRVEAQADEQGRFTAQSVWKAWGDWEFGQKRSPSRWITLLVLRILKRLGR